MNRRNFLQLLAAGLVGSTVDVDKLLWIPGEKKIFIPSPKQLEFYGGAAGGGKTWNLYLKYSLELAKFGTMPELNWQEFKTSLYSSKSAVQPCSRQRSIN